MKKLAVRWGIRLGIFALFAYGISAAAAKPIYFALIMVAPFILGAVSCGWVCPAGLVQDVVFLRKFKIEVPYKIHNKLRLLRYILGGLLIAGAFAFPIAVQRGIAGFTKGEFVAGIALWLAVASTLVSVFIERFFCRYFCPFGAISGTKSIIRPLTINRDEKRCVNCGKCDKVCPMKIAVSRVKSSHSPNCIDCFKCIENCPKKALKFGISSVLRKRSKK